MTRGGQANETANSWKRDERARRTEITRNLPLSPLSSVR